MPLRSVILFLLCRAAAAQGVITTYVGADWVFSGDGQPAVNAPLGNLSGITVDAAGNPVVVDTFNCLVEKILPDGTLSVIAGNGVCGRNPIHSGDGGPATSAGFALPLSAAFDSQGNLYISSSSYVRKIAPDGTVSHFAGSVTGEVGFSGDGGPATEARLATDGGLACDADGNVYIADELNHRIRKVDRSGAITTIAGTGSYQFTGNGGPALSAGVGGPIELAFDPLGNLWVLDVTGAVRKISRDGFIAEVPGVSASSVAFDSAGAAYLGNFGAVYKLAAGSTTPVLIAGTENKVGSSGDGGPAAKALLSEYPYVAVDQAGILYIADRDNSRVRKVGLDGIITTIAGNGHFQYGGEDVPALSAPLGPPAGIAVDVAGNVFFTEDFTHRVRKASRGSDGVVRVTTVAGNGIQGLSADPGPATQAELSSPLGLTIDAAGNLYIADTFNGRVRKVTPQGIISTYAAIVTPVGLAMDRAGNLYVASPSDGRVRKVDAAGQITIIAGTGVQASSGDGGPATAAQLNVPDGLALDSANNLYVTEYYGSRIRMISPGGTITTFAGTGSSGYDGDGGPAVKAAIGQPAGIAVDAADNVYFCDFFGAVRKVDRSGTISTFAGGGQAVDQTGDGQRATNAALSFLDDLAFDSAGNLYITDQKFNRVRVVLATPPVMQVSPSSIVLPEVASGGAPLTQSIAVTVAIAGLSFQVSIQSSGPEKWLTADTVSDATPRLITLTADPARLAPGSYSATVTIRPAAATPAVLTVSVSLSVGAAQSPLLALDRQNLSFTLPQNAASRSATLQVANTGVQTLTYSASAGTDTGGNWLTVSPSGGAAGPGTPSSVSVSANPEGLRPGTYTGTVSVDAGGAGSQAVTVIMTVSGNGKAVLLTQTGLSFTAVAGGGVIPPQTVGVINAGAGVMNWTAGASTTTGGNWLQVSPDSGATDAAGVAPQATVSVNPAGLQEGKYYGTVRVDAPGTANRSRVLTVFLNVLKAGTPVAASVQPAELLFNAAPGGDLPGSQDLFVYNITATPRTFTSTRSEGAVTLLTLPVNGLVAPDRPTRVVVQPEGFFPPGTSTRSLNFQFSDGTVQSVKVTVIYSASAAIPRALSRAARAASPAAACTPSKVVVSLKTLGQSFQVSAGWPVGLSVNAMDDCRNPLVAGTASVWAHFDNGEDDVPLTALGDGTWQGTWRPQRVSPNVTVTVNARTGSLPLAQNAVSGAQSSANDPPLFALSSIANFFATPAPRIRPLAPGSFLAIRGSRLADFSQDADGELPRQLANTRVWFNDLLAPISHADDSQVNVVAPMELDVDTTAQVRIQRGVMLSLPVAVDVAASQISIQQNDGNASALDMPASGDSPFQVDASTPAAAGDTLVLYCTGLGVTTPPLADGAVTLDSPPALATDVTATIGGKDAAVAFAGLMPGSVGIYQVKVVVPPDVVAGPAALTVSRGGQSSPAVKVSLR